MYMENLNMEIEILATKGVYRFIKRTFDNHSDKHPNKKPSVDYCIEKQIKWDNMPDNLIRYEIIYFNMSKSKVERKFLFL